MPRWLIPWVIAAAAVVAAMLVVLVCHARLVDADAARDVAKAELQRAAMKQAGAVVVKDTPGPPAVPSQVRNQVEAVQRAVPEAKVERTEQLESGWLIPTGPDLPSGQPPRSDAGPGAPTSGGEKVVHTPETPTGCVLRRDTPAKIRLVSVQLATKQGARAVVGRFQVIRQLDDTVILDGPIDNDKSTVEALQRLQDAPRLWLVGMGGLREDGRPAASLVGGKGRWGGALSWNREPGPDPRVDVNRFTGFVALRFF